MTKKKAYLTNRNIKERAARHPNLFGNASSDDCRSLPRPPGKTRASWPTELNFHQRKRKKGGMKNDDDDDDEDGNGLSSLPL